MHLLVPDFYLIILYDVLYTTVSYLIFFLFCFKLFSENLYLCSVAL